MNLIFHKYVLFIEFKLILKLCNLNTIDNLVSAAQLIKIIIKLLFVILFFILAIFLIEKITFPSPEKNYNIDVTNDIKSFEKFLGLLIFLILISPAVSEDKIDIWNNQKKKIQKILSLPHKKSAKTIK